MTHPEIALETTAEERNAIRGWLDQDYSVDEDPSTITGHSPKWPSPSVLLSPIPRQRKMTTREGLTVGKDRMMEHIMTGILSKDTMFHLHVDGPCDAAALDKLLCIITAQRDVLADDEHLTPAGLSALEDEKDGNDG